MKCSAKGFPIPEIHWMFKPCSTYDDCDNQQMRHVQVPIIENVFLPH
jgi:hypothetical protein